MNKQLLVLLCCLSMVAIAPACKKKAEKKETRKKKVTKKKKQAKKSQNGKKSQQSQE